MLLIETCIWPFSDVRATHRSFLVATSNSIRGSVCPSICPSVRPSVRPSIRPSVRRSVCPAGRPPQRKSRDAFFSVKKHTDYGRFSLQPANQRRRIAGKASMAMDTAYLIGWLQRKPTLVGMLCDIKERASTLLFLGCRRRECRPIYVLRYMQFAIHGKYSIWIKKIWNEIHAFNLVILKYFIRPLSGRTR